jgi:glutamine synthetase
MLRSLIALNENLMNLQKLLENKNAKHIKVFAGIEQRYFLLLKEIVKSRPDITVIGRTLFGNTASKRTADGRAYFENIKGSILEFIEDVNHEPYRKGIPVKTRHNEVAPNQF